MKRTDIVNTLHRFEREYPVNDWKVDGIYVWPIVKLEIFSKLFHQQNKTKKKVSRNNTLIKIILEFFKLLKSFFFLIQLLFTRKKKEPHILFSGANNYRVHYKGKYINRFFFPMVDYLENELNYRTVTIDFDHQLQDKNYQPRKHLLFLKKYSYASWLLSYVSFKKNRISLHKFSHFIDEVNQVFGLSLSTPKYTSSIIRKIQLIKSYSFIYDIVISKFNVKYCFGLCYYSTPMFSLHHSCFRQNIPSVDIQHGGQGVLHVAYSGFSSIPFEGYSILPSLFWVWDQASYNTIYKWTKNTFHQVEIGGNPWLTYFLTNYPKNENSGTDKIILYTMQFDYVEEYIIEALKMLPPEYKLWLRLHPRKLDSKEEILSNLKSRNLINRVDIENATGRPLPAVLNETLVHISRFSGSVIEATQVGVPTILIDSIGKDIYNDYIESGDAIYLENPNARNIADSIFFLEKRDRKKNSQKENKYKEILNEIVCQL